MTHRSSRALVAEAVEREPVGRCHGIPSPRSRALGTAKTQLFWTPPERGHSRDKQQGWREASSFVCVPPGAARRTAGGPPTGDVSTPNGTRRPNAVNVGRQSSGKVVHLHKAWKATGANQLCLVQAPAGGALWHTSDARHFRERKPHPATGARQPPNVQCQLCYSNRDRKSTRSQRVSR